MSGTSQATPHVTGTAALLLSINPVLSGAELRNIIMQTATRSSALNDKVECGGYVNAKNAVLYIENYQPAPLSLSQNPLPKKMDKSKFDSDTFVYGKNEVYIQFTDNLQKDAVMAQLKNSIRLEDIKAVRYVEVIDSYRIELSKPLTEEMMIQILETDGIACAEPTVVKFSD